MVVDQLSDLQGSSREEVYRLLDLVYLRKDFAVRLLKKLYFQPFRFDLTFIVKLINQIKKSHLSIMGFWGLWGF